MLEPYRDINKPGRKDLDGIEWWACDPYPTWFRWEGNALHERRFVAHAGWMPDDPLIAEQTARLLEIEAWKHQDLAQELRNQAARCRAQI